MESKYRMFKNYMYNDLGITKDDIREWTKEAVKEVALNFLEHHISEYEVDKLIRVAVDKFTKAAIDDKAIRAFINDYEIKLEKRKCTSSALNETKSTFD